VEIKKATLTFVRAEPKRKFNEKIQNAPNRSNIKVIKQEKQNGKQNVKQIELTLLKTPPIWRGFEFRV
jgi:hypothetical protein